MSKELDALRHWLASGDWITWGRNILVALIVVGAAFGLASLLRIGLNKVRRRGGPGAPLVYIVEQLGSYAIIIVGVVVGLSTIGLDLRSLTVFAGAIGVGLGLGLQGVVREFVSGLVLIIDPALKVGDFVQLEGGERGEIDEIGARATRLRTNDELNIVIPNSLMITQKVTNWTYNDHSRRVHVPFSVDEEADTARVREVVLVAAKALPFTLPDGENRRTQVWMTNFSGGGLDFELIVWPTLESSRHLASMHAAYTWAIYDALRAAGIANSTDQLDLNVRALFGRQGDAALRSLDLHKDHPAADEPLAAPTPNDAALAVFDDADRDRVRRAEEAVDDDRRARRVPPDAAPT